MIISKCCHESVYIVENIYNFYVCSICKSGCDIIDVSFSNEGLSYGQGDVREA